jgi:hypothetical protein
VGEKKNKVKKYKRTKKTERKDQRKKDTQRERKKNRKKEKKKRKKKEERQKERKPEREQRQAITIHVNKRVQRDQATESKTQGQTALTEIAPSMSHSVGRFHVLSQGIKADDLVPFDRAREYTAMKCKSKWGQDFQAVACMFFGLKLGPPV